MKRAAALFVALATLPALSQDRCAVPDNLSRVDGKGKCLVILTTQPAEKKSDTLVVWIHGDVSRGGPADYMAGYARRQSEGLGVTTVVLLRPGYEDRNGNRSAGSNHGRRDSYTEENVDAVASALANLKKHHGAKKLLVIGHSGGAAITAATLGRHPGIVDVAYLIACPCNIGAWQPQWYMSVSPITVADKVPPSSRVYAFTGARDSNTGAGLAKEFVSAVSKHGVPAEFQEIPEQGHDFNPKIAEFISPAVEKEIK